MKTIYQDFPHVTQVFFKNQRKYLKKNIVDRVVEAKEFAIQSLLLPSRVVPFCWKDEEGYFCEEFLEGKFLREIKFLSDSDIREVAKAIKKVHLVKPDQDIKNILRMEEVAGGKYRPKAIFRLILSDQRAKFNQVADVAKIEKYITEVGEKLDKRNYNLAIIHGDLSPNNIVITKEGVRIIDWTDARYDIPSADIIQFFYLSKLSPQQQKTFLSEYRPIWMFDELIRMHEIFLLTYDFIYQLKQKREDKTRRLVSSIKRLVERL